MPAYNQYYPTNYQLYPAQYYPQYPAQVPLTQPPQMQTTVQAPAPVQTAPAVSANQSAIIWVNGEKEAALFPVASNSAVPLWDSSNPVIYLKQADASGKPTMRTFDLVERVEAAQNEVSGAGIDISHFAEKADLAAVTSIVGAMQKDIEAIKEEMGNLASQAVKRAVGAKAKKDVTAEDDD